MKTSGIHGEPGVLLRAALVLLLAAVVVGIGLVLFSQPPYPSLAGAVQDALASRGADNPVTAVLLDFRGYDTLLEIAVLTATLAGVWALGPAPLIRETKPSPVLLGLNSVLLPMAPLIAAYLLWAGATRPGGAFQAGAVLAAAGVLFIISGRRPRQRLPETFMRLAIVIGLAVFIGVGLGVMGAGRNFLQYPVDLAGALMLLVELAATVSIAVILAGLFVGGHPGSDP
jgi:multisubunit Na+/H+ antiporter MnhB subunit